MRLLNRPVLFAMLLLPFTVAAQKSGGNSAQLSEIVSAMKATRNMEYKFELSAEYPNGQKDQMKGTAYVDNDRKVLFNDNDAVTLIYDRQWFYKADHREKTVVLVDVKKHLNADYREALENDVFENAALQLYLDSVIKKYAIVKDIRRNHDTAFIELGFPKEVIIKRVSIVFDQKENRMVRYVTQTFQPWRTNEFGKDKGTTKTISCSSFRKFSEGNFKRDKFFKVSNGKPTLKKFKKYQQDLRL